MPSVPISSSVFLSIVSPVYRAEALVEELVLRIEASVRTLTQDYEIILVDDRSPDGSWETMKALAARNPQLRALRLSRNFGQHRAITAGLEHCQGEWVVVMDCDLQDQPEEIPALLAEARKGYDLVLARRGNRQDAWSKKLHSRLFYRVLSFLTDTRQDSTIANFGLYNRKVINAVLAMKDSIRYFPTMVRWVGFNASYLDVKHGSRPSGSSSYNFSRLFQQGQDILLANSDKPLRLTVALGVLISVVAFLFVPVTLWRYYVGQISQPGYTSLIISIWFFSGLLLSVLGMVGLYIGKTYEQVKGRPLYIVDAISENTSPLRSQ